MPRFALVGDDNVVWTVTELADMAEADPRYTPIEVDESVGSGDEYDPKTAVFTRPIPVIPDPVTSLGQLVDVAIAVGQLSVPDLAAALKIDLSAAHVADDGKIVEIDVAVMEAVVEKAVLDGTVDSGPILTIDVVPIEGQPL